MRRAMRQVELVRAVLLGPGAVQAGIAAGYGPAAARRLMWWEAPRKLSFYLLGRSPLCSPSAAAAAWHCMVLEYAVGCCTSMVDLQ